MINNQYAGWTMLLIEPSGKMVVQKKVKANRGSVLQVHPEEFCAGEGIPVEKLEKLDFSKEPFSAIFGAQEPIGRTVWSDNSLYEELGEACKERNKWYLLASYIRRRATGYLEMFNLRVWNVEGPEVEKDLADYVSKRRKEKA